MNVFQLIKTVLDEIYEDLVNDLGSESKADKEVKNKLKYLSEKYIDMPNGVVIDYTDDATRFAYIFKYVTCHSNLVADSLESSRCIVKKLDNDVLTASCVGGGPGSELLGLIKYLQKRSYGGKVQCYLFDRERSWGESWADVNNKLGNDLSISIFQDQFDVTLPSSWLNKKYFNSDIFFFVFFLSEVGTANALPYLKYLISNCKKGSIFVYIDNNNPKFFNQIDNFIDSKGLKILEKNEFNQTLDFNEEKKDLGIYYDKFGSPRLDANRVLRIFRK